MGVDGWVGGCGGARAMSSYSLLPALKLLWRVDPTLVENGVDPEAEELSDRVG